VPRLQSRAPEIEQQLDKRPAWSLPRGWLLDTSMLMWCTRRRNHVGQAWLGAAWSSARRDRDALVVFSGVCLYAFAANGSVNSVGAVHRRVESETHRIGRGRARDAARGACSSAAEFRHSTTASTADSNAKTNALP